MCLAVPGKVIEIQSDALRMARVEFGGVVKEVSLNLVPQANVGDYVVVHAGLALEVMDEQMALETLEAFKDLEEVEKRMS